MTKIGDAKRKLHGKLTGRPDNFSWLIENKLAGSAIPTSKKEVEWLQEEGVKTIVTIRDCLLYTSPSPRDKRQSRMPSSA